MNLPLKPFFVYKSDVFDEFKNKNPEKKLSELTALIADSWNNLDAETKGIYVKKYEEALEKFNQSWVIDTLDPPVKHYRKKHSNKDEKIEPAPKKAKVQLKGNISTQINKSITLEQNWGYDTLQQKKSSNYHYSLFNAICYIQKEFRSHIMNYEMKLRDIEWDRELSGGGFGVEGPVPRYEGMHWSFDATVIDFSKGVNYKFNDSKYLSELNEQIARIPISKRYLAINILREKDFSPQAIKDVLSFLPTKINWKIRFKDDYPSYTWTLIREFGSGYKYDQPLGFYAWEVENDAYGGFYVYKEGNQYGYEHDEDSIDTMTLIEELTRRKI